MINKSDNFAYLNNDSMLKSVLNEILKKKRKEMKMSQKDMSKALGVSVRSYQRFESGANLDLYCECMRVLGLTVIIAPKENIL